MSMRAFAIVIILSLSLHLSAQDTKGPSIYTGFELSPSMGHRILKNPRGVPFIDASNKFRNDREMPVQNISFSIKGGLQLSHKFSLGVGVRYATKGYQQDLNLVGIDSTDPAIPSRIRLINRTRFIEIPIQASFILYRPDRIYYMEAEIYWNKYQDEASISYHHFPNEVKKKKSVNSVPKPISFLGLGLQTGIQHMVTEDLSLRVGPGFRMDTKDLSGLDLILFHWNFSINFSLSYKW
jgi:hypothetical protein